MTSFVSKELVIENGNATALRTLKICQYCSNNSTAFEKNLGMIDTILLQSGHLDRLLEKVGLKAITNSIIGESL
jgi:hypothetical protein